MTTKKIEFGSDAYFALTANNPDWGKYLALGSRVIVVVNGIAYEITDTGTGATDANAAPIAPPAAPTTEARIFTPVPEEGIEPELKVVRTWPTFKPPEAAVAVITTTGETVSPPLVEVPSTISNMTG